MSGSSHGTSRRWMFLALGTVLLLGTSLGVLADRLMLGNDKEGSSQPVSGEIWFDCSREPEPTPQVERERKRREHMNRVQAELQLDSDQKAEVSELLVQYGSEARTFWYDTRAEYCRSLLQLRSDVRALLTPEQQELFRKRVARIDEKMRREHQRPSSEERSER